MTNFMPSPPNLRFIDDGDNDVIVDVIVDVVDVIDGDGDDSDIVVVTNAIKVDDDDDDDYDYDDYDYDVVDVIDGESYSDVVVTNAIKVNGNVIEAMPIGSKTPFNESNYIMFDTVELKPIESKIKQIGGYSMGIFLLIIMTINAFIVLYKLYKFLYTMSIFWNIIILLCSISIAIFATVRLCNVIKEQIQNYVNHLLDMCNPLNIVKKWCKFY